MTHDERETEESGPIQTGPWDTRDRSNSYWCEQCLHWFRRHSWLSEDQHKSIYCNARKHLSNRDLDSDLKEDR